MDAVRSKVQYGGPSGGGTEAGRLPSELEGNETLKNIEPRMVELITNEVHTLCNVGLCNLADMHYQFIYLVVCTQPI